MKEITQASLGRIRKTPETPPRVSVYDVIGAITGLPTSSNCSQVWTRLKERHPEVVTICDDFKFRGQWSSFRIGFPAERRS